MVKLSAGLFPSFRVGGVRPTAATLFLSSELENNKRDTYMFALSCEITLKKYFNLEIESGHPLHFLR